MSLTLIVALFMVNWCHLMSVFVQVSSDSGVMHGLFVVGSPVFVVVSGLIRDVVALVVMTGLMGHVFTSGVVMVTPVGVISVSAVLVGVVVMVDGLVSGVGSMGSCVVLTVGGVAIFTVLSRGNSDNCGKDEGSHISKFDFYLIL